MMKPKFANLISYALLALSLVGIGVVLDDLYIVLRPQDPLGKASDNCAKGDLPSVPNGTGMVATAHVTSCSFGLAHGAETTYVYLHQAGEKDGKESLVFRFANAGNLDRPQITWSDSSSLHVSVSEVGEVTEEVALQDGVKISYSIGKEDMSREESLRLRMREAKSSSIWLIVLTAVCVLIIVFLRRQERVPRPSAD